MGKAFAGFTPFQIECVTPKCNGESDEENSLPLPRSGHRMVCSGSHLYAIGGYNPSILPEEYNDSLWQEHSPLFKELWMFNTISRKWRRLPSSDAMPNELASHSALVDGPLMIVYGGTSVPFGEASSNSVYFCHLPTLKWQKINTSGSLPVPMYGQAVYRRDNKLYVAGGTTGYEFSIDVHVLDMKTFKWKFLVKNLSSGQRIPFSRYRHEMVEHNGYLYVFGGGTRDKTFTLHKLPTYDLNQRIWKFTSTYPDTESESVPKPRKYHVLVQYKQYIYIHGGTNDVETYKDFWRLNMDSMVWQKINTTTDISLCFHAAAVTQEGCIYFFGGLQKDVSERTNKVFRVFVDVPSLLTMAWETVYSSAPHLIKLSENTLLQIGIPPLLVKSLKCPISQQV